MKITLRTAAVTALAGAALVINPTAQATEPVRVGYHSINVDGLNVFYREAGNPEKPAVVLLHGFPSSSHMYRELIPQLASSFHVIAPDYPGFGYSDQPPASQFSYTFDHLAQITDAFLNAAGIQRYAIYVQDYGAPVGFRLFLKHPDKITAIVSQNGNAYNEGLGPFWDEYLRPYWNERTPATEAKVRGLLTIGSTRFQYSAGFRDTNHVSPDAWTLDQMTLDRPGNQEIQLALFYDYQNNVKQYEAWHAALRKYHPAVLAVWGKNDPIFPAPGAEAFKRDVPDAEIHLLNTGHFALEEDANEIAGYMIRFLSKHVQ